MRLKERYNKEIKPTLKQKLGLTNINAVPKLEKVVINVGVGRHAKEKAYLEEVAQNLAAISGQKPVFTKARKSISSFKIREGMTIGLKVTLRGQRMYDFVEKLVNITLPRVRDFRGLNLSQIDKSGNLTIGFKEQTVFPEIKLDKIENTYGLEVTVVTTAKDKEQGAKLLKMLGFPFKKEEVIKKK